VSVTWIAFAPVLLRLTAPVKLFVPVVNVIGLAPASMNVVPRWTQWTATDLVHPVDLVDPTDLVDP